MRHLRWITVLAWIAALYMALIWVPDERVLGVSYRIFYLHLAMAWTALLCFTANFAIELWVLFSRRRRERLDHYAQATAEVGLLTTSATLASGMIWAKVAWGAYWTWDPRLTTTAILWFLYVGYLLLRAAMDPGPRRFIYSAVYAVIVFLDVPIVYLSVRWWRTIHPVVFTDTGINITMQMLQAVMVFFLAVLLLSLDLILLRARQSRQEERIRRLRERRLGEFGQQGS